MATADDVRQLVAGLPGAVEKPAWGQPCFRVREKIFASLDAEGAVLGFSVDRDDRVALVASDPDTYFVQTGHDEKYHFARARLARLGVDELREVLTDAWRRIAPAAAVRAFDDSEP